MRSTILTLQSSWQQLLVWVYMLVSIFLMLLLLQLININSFHIFGLTTVLYIMKKIKKRQKGIENIYSLCYYMQDLNTRVWWNWQTRKIQDLVGDRAGSSPVTRTKKELFQTKQLFFGKVYQLILYLIISNSELLQGYQIFRQVFS